MCISLAPVGLAWNGGLWIWSRFLCACVRPQPYLRHVWTNFVDTWYKDNIWLYTYVHHFVSRWEQRWLTGAILVVKETWCWTHSQPFLGHASTDLVQTWRTVNKWCITYARHLFFEIRSKMADWWPFCYLNVSRTISRTCMVQFCSNLAQPQYKMVYTCTSLYFAIWSKWPTGSLVPILVVNKYGQAL